MPHEFKCLSETEDPTVMEVAVGFISMAAYVDDAFGPDAPAYGQGIYELCMYDNMNIPDEVEARYHANRAEWDAFIDAFLALRRKTPRNAAELKEIEDMNS